MRPRPLVRRAARGSTVMAALVVLGHATSGTAQPVQGEASVVAPTTESMPSSPGVGVTLGPQVQTPIQAAVTTLAAWSASKGAHANAAVMDVATGTLLAAENEHRLVNPASNTKVLTAAVVLDRMGPDYRFTTGLYGKLADGSIPVLVLRGNGDPSLETDELWELAAALRQLGVHRVDSLLVDQTHFDDTFVPPAFGDQPNEWAPFRAPVSAVALERNAVTLNVLPTTRGQRAVAWFDPPGFVDVHGTVGTRAPAAGEGVRLTVSPNGSRLLAEIGGFIGQGAPRARYSKRVDDPRLLAGYVLAEVLREMGIEVHGVPALGGSTERSRLAYVESAPLAVLVRELGKNSDNFYAETLLKALGGFLHGAPAHTQDGADAVVAWLKSEGALEPGTRITNGSGLFDANRVSAFSLATTLRRAYLSSRIGPDFVAQLAVGGVDGTLRSRFKSHAAELSVRAKTGTLDQVVALSGYVLPAPARQAVAFSFVVEGVAGRHAEARERIDRCVEAILAASSH